MYNWEIDKYLDERNHQLTPIEFVDLINSSNQIREILYKNENGEEEFKIKADDNYSNKFKLMDDKPKSLKLTKKDS